jgi:alpha-L-arabinofuranosidase
MIKRSYLVLVVLIFSTWMLCAQNKAGRHASEKISPDLFGIFFEDLSFAADGGLYAELVQNRSFEYTPADRKSWHSLTAWEYLTDGYGYGSVSIETATPVHPNNPHYLLLNVEEEGQEGIGISNAGFDGIVVKAGSGYEVSFFARQISARPVPFTISLRGRKGTVYGEVTITTDSKEWKKYSGKIPVSANDDSARLVMLAKGKGSVALDMISLFPTNTFKKRQNGLRADLAQVIADLQPKFMRFPGGCLVHGDGIGNMYRWKNTIGPVEQRKAQKNIWNYHQTNGLGYFEYFQFCEDIGAKPLPVVAAAVSCQNSGGTWRIGGTGQRGLPMEEMQEYIQEIFDLVEYANGPVSSAWGEKRAAAGHPEPFNLQYIGIGNEDKQTDLFRTRFKMIYDAVRSRHPEITLIGTVGPFPNGDDYEQGWKFANELAIPVVDEHYYEKPEWFLANNTRYDRYDRTKSKVYLGEYASRGNSLFNALSEAAYMTALERNGDLVTLASYAPLIANQQHTSWNPNLIYFSNTTIVPTANYYVQQLFSVNQGDVYYPGKVSFGTTGEADTLLAASCVRDSKTGDLILKFVNAGATERRGEVNLSGLVSNSPMASLSILSGDPAQKNTFEQPTIIVPQTSSYKAGRRFSYTMPAWSLSVLRIKTT